MSKIGVNVGEDFPVDEGAPRETGCNGEGIETLRQWHEQKRQWRQARAEWRARRHALRAQLRDELRQRFHRGERDWHGPQPQHIAIGALALLGLAALIGFSRHDR